jgi:modulator of FtsH protease HflC
MKPAFAWGTIALVMVGAFIGFQSLFTVHRTEQALVLRFGEPIRVITRAGLNTKWPFIDQVVYIDKRVLDLEAPVQEVIASDQKRLVVDAFCTVSHLRPPQVLPDRQFDRGRQFTSIDIDHLVFASCPW